MSTGIIFDNPDTPLGVDASAVTIDVDLVASVEGTAVGFVAGNDSSIVGRVSKSPDANGYVEFAGLTYNGDISPSGTVYRASYRYDNVIYAELFFTVAAAGPTHIYDVLTNPIAPLPDPDFSADYSETLLTETTTSATAESLSSPIIISPFVDGPIELVATGRQAAHATTGSTTFLSIYEGATELARGFWRSTAGGAIGRVEAARRFPGGHFTAAVHSFEVKKWQLLTGTATFLPLESGGPSITLEAIRR